MTTKKLRSACDFCHQTKVKCSGGNPCNGCEQLSIDCVYSASNRIGRPKGSRNKKTIERVKRYKAENESRQRAQQAEDEAANATRHSSPDHCSPASTTSTSITSSTTTNNNTSSSTAASSPANTTSSTVPSSTMAVDWTGVTPVGQQVDKADNANDLFAFPCEPGTAISSVDPVYSIYTGEMSHDLADFDFSHSPSNQPSTSDQSLAIPVFHDVDGGSSFDSYLGSSELKRLSQIDASGPVAASAFSVTDQSGSTSDVSTHHSSTPFTSPHPTPALSSSSTVSSASLSCTCLQDQASMLSKLASTSLNSISLDFDAALDCAMQATRTWDIFLRCRQCAYRLFESKFDSYLVLTSGMRIVLNILNDQLQCLGSIDDQHVVDGQGSFHRRCSISHAKKTWRIGGYEASREESQLLSVTLLSNVATTMVALSSKLCEITSDKNKDAFLLDTSPTSAADDVKVPVASTPTTTTTTATISNSMEPAQKDGAECSYLMDHDMDETAAGFNLKFLHHKACSIDRSAKRFKEDITARARQMIQ